jgi:hypothetical protein
VKNTFSENHLDAPRGNYFAGLGNTAGDDGGRRRLAREKREHAVQISRAIQPQGLSENSASPSNVTAIV